LEKPADTNGVFEVRLKLTEAFAEAVRRNPANRGMRWLGSELARRGASLFNILEEFKEWAADPANARSADEKVRALHARTQRVLADEAQCNRWGRTYKVVMDGQSAFTEDDARVKPVEDLLADWADWGWAVEKTRRAYFPADGKMHGVIAPDFGGRLR
jgi:hypothetical protein